MLLSSITYGFAMLEMEQNRRTGTMVWLAITGLFGVAFIHFELSGIAAAIGSVGGGGQGPDFLKDLDGLETTRSNRLVVLPTLQTTADPDVFAIGDCAACPRPGFDTPVPPRAQAAHQQALHMLRQFRQRLSGKPLQPYIYRDFGSLVSLGRYSTVGSLMGFLVGTSIFIDGPFAIHVSFAL